MPALLQGDVDAPFPCDPVIRGLNEKTFSSQPRSFASGERMTLQGAINKSFLLLVVLMAGAFWPWSQYLSTGDASVAGSSIMIGAIGGLIVGAHHQLQGDGRLRTSQFRTLPSKALPWADSRRSWSVVIPESQFRLWD